MSPEDKPRRDKKGRLLPGGTANPGGRPKAMREYQEWLRKNALEKAKKALLACLASKDGKVRMMAVKEVNDRLLGKAPQSVQTEDGETLKLVPVIMVPQESDD